MDKRLIGVVGIVVAIIFLGLSSVSTSWFTAGEGNSSIGAGPVWVARCSLECNRHFLMEKARGDAQELWAASGLGYAASVFLLTLWLSITMILSLIQTRAAKWLGLITSVFTIMTLMSGMAFVTLKPSQIGDLTAGVGVALMLFGCIFGIAGCVFSVLGASNQLAAPAAPAGTQGFPQGYPKQGYEGYPKQGAAPPGAYPQQWGTPHQR